MTNAKKPWRKDGLSDTQKQTDSRQTDKLKNEKIHWQEDGLWCTKNDAHAEKGRQIKWRTHRNRETGKMTNGKKHWQIDGLSGTQNERRTETNRQTDKMAEWKVRLTDGQTARHTDRQRNDEQTETLTVRLERPTEKHTDLLVYWQTDRQTAIHTTEQTKKWRKDRTTDWYTHCQTERPT